MTPSWCDERVHRFHESWTYRKRPSYVGFIVG